MEAYCNPSIWEGEAEGSGVPRHRELVRYTAEGRIRKKEEERTEKMPPCLAPLIMWVSAVHSGKGPHIHSALAEDLAKYHAIQFIPWNTWVRDPCRSSEELLKLLRVPAHPSPQLSYSNCRSVSLTGTLTCPSSCELHTDCLRFSHLFTPVLFLFQDANRVAPCVSVLPADSSLAPLGLSGPQHF